jgi:hypothetical protein
MTLTMSEEILHAVREEIKITVNGKIDKIHAVLMEQNRAFEEQVRLQKEFNEKFDNHMERVVPYLSAYEGIRYFGGGAMFWAGVFGAVGALIFYTKSIFK